MAITTKTIERWAINAEAMFRSIMPEIGIPYPQPVITVIAHFNCENSVPFDNAVSGMRT